MVRCFLLSILVVLTLGGCASPIVERKVPIDIAADERTPANYRLHPRDVVHISVFQEPDMETEQRIAQDGTVNIALAGRVKIGGLTVEEAAEAIAGKLRGAYLVNPQVSVHIVEYAPHRFSVLGQVNQPGAFEIPSEEVVTLPTAVAMAGGNTRIANLRRILVTRKKAEGVYDITVNLSTPQGRQFVVQEGDMIFVPESLF